MTIQDYIVVKSLYKQYEQHPQREEKVVHGILEGMKGQTFKKSQKMLLEFMQTLTDKPTNVILRFKIGEKEYGLIPDLENMTTEEFLFIDKYSKDINSLHKLMAVLYRPIKNQYGKKYEVEEFDPIKLNYDDMLGVDCKVWISVESFFLSIYQSFVINTLKSGMEKAPKNRNSQEENE